MQTPQTPQTPQTLQTLQITPQTLQTLQTPQTLIRVGSASVRVPVVRFAVSLLAVTVRQASQKDMPEREEASELQEIFPRTFCSMVKPGY